MSLGLRCIDQSLPGTARPPAVLGRPLWRLVASACGVVAVTAAWVSTIAGRATSADLLWFWGPKAQRFASVGGIDAEFLRIPELQYMHPAYPPLLPNLYAWLTLISGTFSWRALTLLFPIALTLSWLFLKSVWVRQIGTELGEVLAATAAGCLSLIGIRHSFGGIAEMPLLLFELTGVALLCVRPATAAIHLWAGICVAGAVLTKVEGLAVVVPAVATFIAIEPQPSRIRAGVLAGLPSTIGLACWFWFGRENNIFSGYGGLTSGGALDFDLLPMVVTAMIRSVGAVANGLPYWLPLLAVIAIRRLDRRMLIPVSSAVGLVGFLVFSYLHGSPDPTKWIDWSCARVLSPIPVLLLLGVSLGCRGWSRVEMRNRRGEATSPGGS